MDTVAAKLQRISQATEVHEQVLPRSLRRNEFAIWPDNGPDTNPVHLCLSLTDKGLHALKNSFETILEERKDEISPRMRNILIGLYGDWMWMDDRIDRVTGEIEGVSLTEERPLIAVETLLRGSDLCPDNTARAVERCWDASPNVAVDISGCCSSKPPRSS